MHILNRRLLQRADFRKDSVLVFISLLRCHRKESVLVQYLISQIAGPGRTQRLVKLLVVLTSVDVMLYFRK